MNEWFDIIKIFTPIIGIIVVIVGVLITHRFTSKRDRKNKIRELRLGYLIETYRKVLDVGLLADNPNEAELEKIHSKIRSISQDIQLFGTKEQIESWFEITNETATPEIRNQKYKDLLKEFRDTVRKELDFDEIKVDVKLQQPKKQKVDKSIRVKR